MITEKELQAVKLSPTKKDFYQIWNELLDTASKLSDRWTPAETNEADPGIILLKVLTAIADKINYTIDKNILEAFMPSATQAESMRKLCEMLGYNIKYYQSATTQVNIAYTDAMEDTTSLTLPKYSNITNSDNTINYVTLSPITIERNQTSRTVECIEGQIRHCEGWQPIKADLLDDNHRYFLPEKSIAENGIFIYTAMSETLDDGTIKWSEDESKEWRKETNLNTQLLGDLVYKFGYSSKEDRPYIQFPTDIEELISDGLLISYIQTNGLNGNIRAGGLSQITNIDNPDAYKVTNITAATNGANIETITQAYNNYKKTIGTFDTLVTCRDYMNKIYQLTDSRNNPLVSNIIVTDIRDDLNKTTPICTVDESGVFFVDTVLNSDKTQDNITNFDLILYPFTAYTGITGSENDYKKSFQYNKDAFDDISYELDDTKTIAHTYKLPSTGDLACIKNYLKLNAKIYTTYKVNTFEEADILDHIKAAIYKRFNLRNIDFCEEIPYDDILDCIIAADTRIKDVALAEPELETKYSVVQASGVAEDKEIDAATADITNKLIARNVLAGRVALFDYDADFSTSFDERLPDSTDSRYIFDNVAKINTEFTLPKDTLSETTPYTLQENEFIKFKARNLKTDITYPAYVNYFLHLSSENQTIKNNSEYKLEDGEYLLINYTDSSSEESINTVYSSGTIIRPSGFTDDLADSRGYKNAGHSPKKKTGYSFEEKYKTAIATVGGMFTLGPTEQIEHRAVVSVSFPKTRGKVINVFWFKNNETASAQETSENIVNFWENGETTYTLKDGEYFFWTDQNKLDMAYYGSGAEITRSNTNFQFSRSKKANEISAEDILTYGLIESIPWVSKSMPAANMITVDEYQFITLTTGDTLYSLQLSEATGKVQEAKYQFLGKDNIEQLPKISIGDDSGWLYKEGLNLNIGPGITQKVLKNQKITITTSDSAEHFEFDGNEEGKNYGISANYLIQTGEPELVVRDVDGLLLKTIDLDWPVYKLATHGQMIDAPVDLYNSANYFTKISIPAIQETSVDDELTSLNVLMKSDAQQFGLIMFYCDNGNMSSTALTGPYLTAVNTAGENVELGIYNNKIGTVNDAWWDGLQDAAKIKCYLRKGINIVKIPSICTLSLHCGTKPDNLLFGRLDLINITDEHILNKKLNIVNEADFLSVLRSLDTGHIFYYNNIVDNAMLIDLSNDEKITDPHILYDYNNINNNFVISEIDADYLATGITLARTSKK